MLRTSIIGLATLLFAVAVWTSPAAADRCPPLPVNGGDTCECDVQNYGSKDDEGVTITVYSTAGPVATCGPLTITAGTGTACYYNFGSAANCGCTVTGEAGTTRTALSVVDVFFASPFASVGCSR